MNRLTTIAAIGSPIALVMTLLVAVPLMFTEDSCATTMPGANPGGSGSAADVVRPRLASQSSVGIWKGQQMRNAAVIAAIGHKRGVSARGQAIAIMTAMGESSLRAVDHGDIAGPDSRGLFQQRTSWGSYEQRMDPAASADLFYRALARVGGWEQLEPTIAAHRVQRNADPNHYTRFWNDAVNVLAEATGQEVDETFVDTAPACSDDLMPAAWSSGEDCSFGGVKNPLSCRQALAKAAGIARNSACRSDLPGGTWRRWCLAFVAKAYGYRFAGEPTAKAMYRTLAGRGLVSKSKEIPAGALVFFDSSDPAGHVALYAGNGQAFSNDYMRPGCIDLTPMSRMGSGGNYLGWAPPVFPKGG